MESQNKRNMICEETQIRILDLGPNITSGLKKKK